MSWTLDSSRFLSNEREFHCLAQRPTLAVIARMARRIFPLIVHETEDPWPTVVALSGMDLADRLATGGAVVPEDAARVVEELHPGPLPPVETDQLTIRPGVRACIVYVAEATRVVARWRRGGRNGHAGSQENDPRQVARLAAAVRILGSVAADKLGGRAETLDALFAHEVKRLAGGDMSYVEIGPPTDPSPLGPLGQLWPAGPPAWFRDADKVLAGLAPDPNDRPTDGPGHPAERFVASSDVARLAFSCCDPAIDMANSAFPLASSRRTASDAEDERLLVVGEAIGERLVRLIGGLAMESALHRDRAAAILVMRDRRHFAPAVDRRLALRLGLDDSAEACATFRSTLAAEFYGWLRKSPAARAALAGRFDDDGRFLVRRPELTIPFNRD